MHEASLVVELRRQVEDLMKQHGAARVTVVKVRIGEFSGVEPDLLAARFAEQVDETPLQGAELRMTRAVLEGACRECRTRFPIRRFRFACPACGSSAVDVTGGEELLLESVTMEADECLNPSQH